ncbi:hypothetical protein FGG08_002546 [Glutinoglossum americanum]|uniref:SET domain-containing protein n=1 Tax=Glutinoglossum americanum TaxID=1670608 RepID=A0A9P8L4E2_9PEZI|nr:hypothetical protein FGG08_002546 [Glutinoglossum americanum]
MDIGYPELAVGDAYKSILLIDAALGHSSNLGWQVRLQLGMKLWYPGASDDQCFGQASINSLIGIIQPSAHTVIAKSLIYLQSYPECIAMCQLTMGKFPDWTFLVEHLTIARERLETKRILLDRLGITEKEKNQRMRLGITLVRPYPWMPARFLRREQALIDSLNEELETWGPKCKIQPSSFKPSIPSHIRGINTIPESMGMFATGLIRKGEQVFVDTTPAGFSLRNVSLFCGNCCDNLPLAPVALECCAISLFCSTKCRDLALAQYHSPMCGRDLNWVYIDFQSPPTEIPDFRPPIFLRLLAMCIQRGVHPLQHPTIARLVPAYTSIHPEGWSLHGNIYAPIMILEAFGINIYTDLRFDTWVLQTMWWRFKNNASAEVTSEQPIITSNPFLSCVNHSCEPNVASRFGSGTTAGLEALREIREGEELFISYIPLDGMQKVDRRKNLAPYFGGPCSCTRCEREP